MFENMNLYIIYAKKVVIIDKNLRLVSKIWKSYSIKFTYPAKDRG